jgi:hypothetical protein
MRRLLTATAVTLVAVAALAASAAAKEMSVALASGPPTLDAGQPWTGELLVHGEPAMLSEATPAITFTDRDSGATRTFDGARAATRAPDGQLVYRVRVVLPEGLWEWGLVDGVTDRFYEGGLVRVGDVSAAAPPATGEPTPAAAAAAEDGLPTWPMVAGGIAVLLLAGVAALVVRGRRLQPAA